MTRIFLFFIICLCVVSCKEQEGGEGQPCYPNGTCDEGLVCVDGVCASESADADTDSDDAGPDDAGSDEPFDGQCRSNADCSNGLDCDGVEQCVDHACMPGEPLDCEDEDPCTMDSCSEDEGGCVNDPLDEDSDGYVAEKAPDGEDCGGTDCDDDNRDAYPGAPMVECSGLDHDCNGNPDEDNDGDGHVSFACEGGDDCYGANPDVVLGECSGVNECCDGCWQVNGCWYDDTTGYLWEDPPMGGYLTWNDAIAYCAGLSLAGFGPGEWELPSISTLRTLIRGCPDTEDGGACGVTDACLEESCWHDCEGCDGGGGPGAEGCYWDPALEGGCEWYWSSSSYAGSPSCAWAVYFTSGYVPSDDKANVYAARCVRSGP